MRPRVRSINRSKGAGQLAPSVPPLPHPYPGPIRNGTTAQVTDVDPDTGTVTLRLPDGRSVTIDEAQAARSDLRLAYVQHPFPAQGQTTDTAHLIVAEHTTSEGSYVAITRAREQTHIYAAIEPEPQTDRLAALSDRMSRSEPDIPSIRTPLARESAITAEMTQAREGREPERSDQELTAEVRASRRDETPPLTVISDHQALAPSALGDQPHPRDDGIGQTGSSAVLADEQKQRWPRRHEPDLAKLELANDDRLEHRGHDGWERALAVTRGCRPGRRPPARRSSPRRSPGPCRLRRERS
jgi:hypothetical protein